MSHVKSREPLTTPQCVSEFLGSWNGLMCLVNHLIEGPTVQVSSDLYSVPPPLLLRIPFLACDHQVADPGTLLLVL